jgi:transcriptional antiterminator RfaH
MPFVPLETYLYPPDLLAPARPDADGTQWWVLHTRPRAEKSLARQLLKHEVGFYLPLYEQRKRHRGRNLRTHLPLFPGYLFLHGDHAGRLRALETNLVSQALPVPDARRLLMDLERVRRLIESGKPITPEERLEPGQPVEIVAGPMQGMKGRILRRGKQWTFFVEVNFLQRGASVEIDAEVCRAIEE